MNRLQILLRVVLEGFREIVTLGDALGDVGEDGLEGGVTLLLGDQLQRAEERQAGDDEGRQLTGHHGHVVLRHLRTEGEAGLGGGGGRRGLGAGRVGHERGDHEAFRHELLAGLRVVGGVDPSGGLGPVAVDGGVLVVGHGRFGWVLKFRYT